MKYKDIVKEIKRMYKKLGVKADYFSYDNAEKRVITDQTFRSLVVNFFDNFNDRVGTIQSIAIQSQMIMIWSDLDKLSNMARDIRIKIKNTRYQRTSFFVATTKDEETFSLISQAELTMLNLGEELDLRLHRYQEAIDSALLSDSSRLIQEIGKLLQQFESMWTIRVEGIESYRHIT